MSKRWRIIIWVAVAGFSVTGWVRSYFHADTLMYQSTNSRYAIGLVPGSLAVAYSKWGFVSKPWVETGFRFRGPPWGSEKPRRSESVTSQLGGVDTRLTESMYGYPLERRPSFETTFGFQWIHGDLCSRYQDGPFVEPHTFDSSLDYWNRAVAVPFWFLILLSGVPLLMPYVRQKPKGKCPQCGYDLRATPDRCPECGYQQKFEKA